MREIISSTLRMTATKKSKSPNTNQLFSFHFEFLNRKSKCLKVITKIIEIKLYNTCMPPEIILSKKTQKVQYPNINQYFGFFGL